MYKFKIYQLKAGIPAGELGVTKFVACCNKPSVLWLCWLGDRRGIRPVKTWDILVCWW